MMPLAMLISLFMSSHEVVCDYKLNITIVGPQKDKGQHFIALFNKAEDFLKTPLSGMIIPQEDDHSVEVVFDDLCPGNYAVSVYFDKNMNGKLDTNFLGIPREPTAASNGAKGRMGPPKYKDAKFELTAPETEITIRYKK